MAVACHTFLSVHTTSSVVLHWCDVAQERQSPLVAVACQILPWMQTTFDVVPHWRDVWQEELPEGVCVVGVCGGCATLRSGGEWEARLTLVPRPALPPSPPAAAAGAAVRTPEQAGTAADLHGVKGEAVAVGGAGPARRPDRAPSGPARPDGGQAPGAPGVSGSAGTAAVPVGNSPAPMDVDEATVSGAGGADGGSVGGGLGDRGGGGSERGVAGEDGGRWRWRPLEMRVLPDWAAGVRDTPLPPALMTRLQVRSPALLSTALFQAESEGAGYLSGQAGSGVDHLLRIAALMAQLAASATSAPRPGAPD